MDSSIDHFHSFMEQVRVTINTRDLHWPPDAHDGGSDHPSILGFMCESDLAYPKQLVVDVAAFACTTTNAAYVTDISLDITTTTLLGPILDPAATPTHLTTAAHHDQEWDCKFIAKAVDGANRAVKCDVRSPSAQSSPVMTKRWPS